MTALTMHAVHLELGGSAALDGIDLSVEPGELVAVTGRSGSGKSSLLNVAGGLIPPTRGGVAVGGESLSDRSGDDLAAVRRRHIGFVFQSLNLLPRISILDNVALPLELDGRQTAAARQAAAEALEIVGLAGRGDDTPAGLSGGEQQRVAVARALATEPTLLLGDEPTAALDAITAGDVMALIRRTCDNSGAAALIVTHDPAQAAWADRVIRLRDGRLSQETVASEALPAITAEGSQP